MIVVYIIGGLVVGFVALQLIMVWAMRRRKGKPVTGLSGVYEAAVSSGAPALFYFFSPSCGACRAMTPVVRDLASKRKSVFAVDISQDIATARRFGVMGTPATVLVAEGVIREILIGPQPPERLQTLLALE